MYTGSQVNNHPEKNVVNEYRAKTYTSRTGSTFFCKVSLHRGPVLKARVRNHNQIGPAYRNMLRELDQLAEAETYATR